MERYIIEWKDPEKFNWCYYTSAGKNKEEAVALFNSIVIHSNKYLFRLVYELYEVIKEMKEGE